MYVIRLFFYKHSIITDSTNRHFKLKKPKGKRLSVIFFVPNGVKTDFLKSLPYIVAIEI